MRGGQARIGHGRRTACVLDTTAGNRAFGQQAFGTHKIRSRGIDGHLRFRHRGSQGGAIIAALGKPRLERQSGDGAAMRCKAAARIDRAEPPQPFARLGQRGRGGRIDEGEARST